MKQRILIIDDDILLNRINERILYEAGLVSELHIVLNGKEALDYLVIRITKEYPLPDIIILDLNMPVMDGFQFLDEFNSLDLPYKRNIEVVVFTDSNNWKDRQKAISKGVKSFIDKPYLLRGLTDVICRMSAIRAGDVSGRSGSIL